MTQSLDHLTPPSVARTTRSWVSKTTLQQVRICNFWNAVIWFSDIPYAASPCPAWSSRLHLAAVTGRTEAPRATVAASRSPKYTTSTFVPTSAYSVGQVAVRDAPADRMPVIRAGDIAQRPVAAHVAINYRLFAHHHRIRIVQRYAAQLAPHPLRARICLSAFQPMKSPFRILTANPMPASYGLYSVCMSLPHSR